MQRDALAIGIDIGGTAVKLGLVRPGDGLLAESEIATPVAVSPEQAAHAIAAAVLELMTDREVAAVGVGCAGLVSAATGVVHVSPNLPRWHDVPLGAILRTELRRPVAVLNDANAFALAEATAGAGHGLSPMVGLTLGTGVGGAVVEEGRLAAGLHGFGGEAGHMSIDMDGERCPCGNRGCLELYIGRRALVAAYLNRARWVPGEAAYELARGDRTALEPKLLCEAAQRGDAQAQAIFIRAGEVLGVALANLSNLIDPAAFVIGGGIAQAGELLFDPARRTLAERAMIGRKRVAPVLPAALGTRAGVIGAGLHALQRRSLDGRTACPGGK